MARVILADRVEPGLIGGSVRRAQAAADALLQDAQSQAAEIVARARTDAEAQAREQTIATLLEASAARDLALVDARKQVLELGVAVAGKLLDTALNADPALIETLVHPLLSRVRRARRLELQLHPDDARTLAPRLDALASRSGVGCPIRLQSDASLLRGSCVLVGDLGTLDARVETRLDLVARALEPLLGHPGRGSGAE